MYILGVSCYYHDAAAALLAVVGQAVADRDRVQRQAARRRHVEDAEHRRAGRGGPGDGGPGALDRHVPRDHGQADAAVVGSALVTEIEKAKSVDAATAALAERVRSFKEAARHGLSRREVAP